MSVLTFLQLFSASAFLFYGVVCLFSPKMVEEFERYRLKKFRVLTGSLEVVGALGQFGGFFSPQLLWASSLGLTCLMICGVWARWRIRDPWTAFVPAVSLMVINGILVLAIGI